MRSELRVLPPINKDVDGLRMCPNLVDHERACATFIAYAEVPSLDGLVA